MGKEFVGKISNEIIINSFVNCGITNSLENLDDEELDILDHDSDTSAYDGDSIHDDDGVCDDSICGDSDIYNDNW